MDVTVPQPLNRTRQAAAVTLGSLAAAGVALRVVDPREHTVTPPCPFRVMTGWWCPFCGGTRAVAMLARGDLASAWRYNAIVVVLVLVVVAVALLAVVRPTIATSMVRGRRVPWTGLVVVSGLFCVYRNLPGWPEDHLRYPGA